MQERPLKAVGVELVEEVDVEVDDAAVCIVRIVDIGGLGERRGASIHGRVLRVEEGFGRIEFRGAGL